MKARDLLDGRIWTFSNFLSLLRVLLFPLAGYALYMEKGTGDISYRNMAIIILFVMVVTDIFDGYFARLLNQVSRLGQFLDPLADKIATIGMACVLYHFRDFPLWLIFVLLIRDIYNIYGGFVLFYKMDIQVRPNLLGKILVGILGLAALVFIISPQNNLYGVTLQDTVVALVLVLSVLSTIDYWRTYSYLYFDRQR